jgi:MFS family permease
MDRFNSFWLRYDFFPTKNSIIKISCLFLNSKECLFCLPATILVDFFGARKIAVIGGLLSGTGILCSSFVTFMPMYFLTYSITFGIGQALLMSSTFSILPHYFKQRIGLANGIMNAGAAVITVTLPIVTAKCLKELGLVDTFYVLSALSYSTVFFALTYKPMLPDEYSATISFSHRLKASFGTGLFKKPKFIMWCLTCLVGLYGAMNIVLTIVCVTEIPKILISSIYFISFKKDHHSIVTFPDR